MDGIIISSLILDRWNEEISTSKETKWRRDNEKAIKIGSNSN